jgi:hypothetical protein
LREIEAEADALVIQELIQMSQAGEWEIAWSRRQESQFAIS